MLLAEALIRLLELWDTGVLDGLQETLLRDRIYIVLIQILNRTLLAQNPAERSGADHCLEATAYGILTLSAISGVPGIAFHQNEVTSAIQGGQNILDRSRGQWAKPQYLWIEKVTYGSHNLSEAYCLAAMTPPKNCHVWSDKVKNLFHVPEEAVRNNSRFLSTVRIFNAVPFWKIQASVIEGYTFLPQLDSSATDILPRQKGAKNEYLNLVPCIWTIVNHHHNLFLPTNLLWDMMVLTVLNFRVDEYMETTGAELTKDNFDQAKSTIRGLCAVEEPKMLGVTTKPPGDSAQVITGCHSEVTSNEDKIIKVETCCDTAQVNGIDALIGEINEKYAPPLISFRAIIGQYTHAMLQYPRVLGASGSDYSNFSALLCNFLLSHVSQISDNSHFAAQTSWSSSTTTVFANPSTSFYTWVHTIGADSVSCPFSFAFFTCLLGATSGLPGCGTSQKQADDCFDSAHQKYLAQDLCAHLAVMSRLYNDYGSVARDRVEGNINSINFSEFHTDIVNLPDFNNEETASTREKMLKEHLLKLAEHERSCAELAFERLLKDLAGKEGSIKRESDRLKINAVRLFFEVTKLYTDLYMARDLSNRTKPEENVKETGVE